MGVLVLRVDNGNGFSRVARPLAMEVLDRPLSLIQQLAGMPLRTLEGRGAGMKGEVWEPAWIPPGTCVAREPVVTACAVAEAT